MYYFAHVRLTSTLQILLFATTRDPWVQQDDKIKTRRRLFSFPWKCVTRTYSEVRDDTRTHREIKSRMRKISDTTRPVIIPAKSLTLRTVTRVIWLSQTRVPMDTRREKRVSQFRFCFGTIECNVDEQKTHAGVSTRIVRQHYGLSKRSSYALVNFRS